MLDWADKRSTGKVALRRDGEMRDGESIAKDTRVDTRQPRPSAALSREAETT
jgi:hypothetical protein